MRQEPVFKDKTSADDQTALKTIPRRRRGRRGPPNDTGLTEIVYSRAGKILLLSLHAEVQRLLHYSFEAANAHVLLCDAFPDRMPGLKAKFFVDAIRTALNKANPPLQQELSEHVKQHPEWVREIAALVNLITTCLLILLNAS